MNIDLQPLWDFLSQTSNFIIGFNICMGYLIKKSPFISNRYIDLLVLLFSVAVTPYFFEPYILGIMWGVIYAVLSFKLYDWFFSWLFKINPDREEEDPTRPRLITPPCYALLMVPLLCLPLSGCASFAPNYSALPEDATREQRREAALADTRAALASKRNQAIAEVVISESGKYAVSTVKDRVDKEAIKTQLKGCGEAGLALLSSGKQITPDQMRSVFSISSLTSKLDAEKFSKQFSTAFEPIQDYIDEVSQTDDPKLLRDWFEILCRSSIKAGS